MTEAMAGTGRSALVRWRWTVTTAFGLGGIAVSAWGPRLPAVKADLGIGTATIGLLLAGVTVGAILGLLASTPVLHWLGTRRSLAGALLLIAAAMTALGLALMLGSVPLVAAVFVIIGLGIGILDVLINVEGSAVERAAGRTLMPMMHAAWSIGVAVGAGSGAACAALGVSPAAQFIAEALVIAATALGTAAGIPGGRRAPAEEPHQDRGAKLRQWLRDLHNTLQVTTVLVTHDQEEAMEVADRLAIINHGHLEQVGTPADMYDHPANEFVLTFLGPATRLDGQWVRPHDLVVHPLEDGKPGPGAREGTVARGTHLGFEVKVDVDLNDDGSCWVQLSRGSAAELGLQAGQRVWVARSDATDTPEHRHPILSA